MGRAITIKRPDVVALVEKAAAEITGGNKTELVATAVRRLLEETARKQSLFGASADSVRVRQGFDLTRPVLDETMDAETGREIRR